jgi:hypothetical protein
MKRRCALSTRSAVHRRLCASASFGASAMRLSMEQKHTVYPLLSVFLSSPSGLSKTQITLSLLAISLQESWHSYPLPLAILKEWAAFAKISGGPFMTQFHRGMGGETQMRERFSHFCRYFARFAIESIISIQTYQVHIQAHFRSRLCTQKVREGREGPPASVLRSLG